MSRKPLFFCLIASLAAHLALFVSWRGDSGPVEGRRPIPVFLKPPVSNPVMPPPAAPAKSLPARRPEHERTSSPAKAPDAPPVSAPGPAAEEDSVAGMEDPAIMPVSAGSASEGSPAPAQDVSLPMPGAEEPPSIETMPRYAHNPKPVYPRLAAERGWEGEVLLRVRVTAGGTVLNAEVERSSGYPVLDRAACKGVEGWRFEPARRGRLAVESTVLIPIPFMLKRN